MRVLRHLERVLAVDVDSGCQKLVFLDDVRQNLAFLQDTRQAREGRD